MTNPDAESCSVARPERAHHPDVKRVELSFRGHARDYFRIWIRNLCLTLVTLGLYSAWARVRARRYFYEQTLLDGAPFRYGAAPAEISKARVAGVAVLAALVLAFPGVALAPIQYGLPFAALVAPWWLVRVLRFEAANSSHRNLRFAFHGTYATVARALLGAAVVAATIVGLPWASYRLKRYLASRTSYGGVLAQFEPRGERLFARCALAASIALVSVAATITLAALSLSWSAAVPPWAPALLLPSHVGWLWASCLVQAHLGNAWWGSLRWGPLRFESRLCPRELFVLRLTNIAAMVLSLGLLTPWATVRLTRYRVERLAVFSTGSWETFWPDEEATGTSPSELTDAPCSVSS